MGYRRISQAHEGYWPIPSQTTPKAHRFQNVRNYTRGFTQNRLGTVGAGGFLDATWRRRQFDQFALEADVDASKDPGRVGQGSQPHQPMEET
jgi:hypothetical protein